MVMPLNNLLCQKDKVPVLVQLGGLEPPTSCSTDRRSNQLSYNCIPWRGPLKEGVANGPETRCNASLWQGREASDYSRSEGISRSFALVRGPRSPDEAERNPGPVHPRF